MYMNSHATNSTVSSRVEARARISDLDAQISMLEAAPSSLRNERDAFQEQLDSCIYPVLTLPTEIVSEIFTHFVPVYPARPPLVGLLSPSTLGQVCRTWRQIAISTPSLWRAIRLDLDNRINRPTQLRLLDTWLERSRTSPLSISLDYSVRDMYLAILPFIETVFRHAFHFEEMNVRLPFRYMAFLPIQNFPVLHTLTFRPSDVCPAGADPILLFDQAPNLTNVTVNGYFDPFLLILPWSQITTINALCLFEEELIEILRLAVNLVRFSVNLFATDNRPPMPVVPPHMHLQDLTFHVSPLPTAEEIHIFDELTLPALRSLEVP
ncbi:hypothetical protein FB451DRAFT_1135233 [Mycena latifolia]|nr:hypothetical protein FB451DRAFT_1135233 [Mycena latifolia]